MPTLGVRGLAQKAKKLRRLLMLLLVVFIALLAGVLVAVAWLIFGHLNWSRSDVIATCGIAAVIGGAAAAVIGPPLFDGWLREREKRSQPPLPSVGKGGLVQTADDHGKIAEVFRGAKDQIFRKGNTSRER
jgi:hypothetical protein